MPSGGATSAVWELSLASPTGWNHLDVAGTLPAPRLRSVALYDSLRDRIVVFGGTTGSSDLNEVWELTLSGTPTWNQITPVGTAPLGRAGASGVLDLSRDRLVIYGGAGDDPAHSSDPVYFDDVWSLSLSSPEWTQVIPDSGGPVGRWNHGAVYDAAFDRMLIYGGFGPGFTNIPDGLWSLSFSGDVAWTLLAPTGPAPATRSFYAFAFDRPRNRWLMDGRRAGVFGSDLYSVELSQVPAWDSLHVASAFPPARDEPAIAYDALRDRVLLFGGGTGAARADLWELSLSPTYTWTQVLAAEYSFTPRFATTPIFDPDRRRIVTFGGDYAYQWHADYYNVPYGDALTLSSDDYPQTGLLSAERSGPAPRCNHTMVLDRAHNRAIVFGGRVSGLVPNNELWFLDLVTGAWTRPSVAGVPPTARYGHCAIFDAPRNRMLVYGGRCQSYSAPAFDSLSSEVWSLSLADPVSWTLLTPAGPRPEGRYYSSAVYDPGNDQVVVFGGRYDAIHPSVAWSLSLAGQPSWSRLTPLGNAPSARYLHSACYDSKRHRMLLFGGKLYPNADDAFNDTWGLSLDGAPTWSFIATPAGAPSGRYASGAVYDSVRDEMVVFWGTSGGCAYGLRTDILRLSFANDATPVQLSLLRADAAPGQVDLTWYSSGTLSSTFTVYRREVSTSWIAIGEVPAAGDGRIEYVDRTVSPGARYAYRLGQEGGTFSSETWVSVPARFSLQLEPPRPNPGAGDFSIAFTLPNAARATIELLDVAGRSMMTREVSGLGAGVHRVRLGERGYAPGIYLVRLRQGGFEVTARAVVVH